MDDHAPLLSLLLALGYPDPEGVCHGFALRWLEAVFIGQEKHFEKRLIIINRCFVDLPMLLQLIAEKQPLELEKHERDLLEFNIPAFCDSLMVYQDPSLFPAVCSDEYCQENTRLSSTVASSAPIEALGGLRTIYSEYLIYTFDEIINYLIELEKIFAAITTSSQPIGILLSNREHTTPLCYKPGWGWMARDINADSSERRPLIFRTADTPYSLKEKIIAGLHTPLNSPYIILDAKVILTGADPRLKILKKTLALFKQSHLITPEILRRSEPISTTEDEDLFDRVLERYDRSMLKKIRPYHEQISITEADFHLNISEGMISGHIKFTQELIKFFKPDFDFNAYSTRS